MKELFFYKGKWWYIWILGSVFYLREIREGGLEGENYRRKKIYEEICNLDEDNERVIVMFEGKGCS